MSRFIELTASQGGHVVYVDPLRISGVSIRYGSQPGASETAVYYDGFVVYVVEKPDTVLKRIEDAVAGSGKGELDALSRRVDALALRIDSLAARVAKMPSRLISMICDAIEAVREETSPTDKP